MRRHRLDPLSLIPGLFFVAVGGAYLGRFLDPSVVHVRWLGAVMLVALGFAFLASAVRSRDDDTPPRN